MELKQLYKEVTTDGLKSVLNTIRNIDDNITISELREYLTKQVDTATKREASILNRKALSFKNKCFKIIYSPDNTTLFQVLEVKEDRSMGIEYKAIVNSICNYKGNISIKESEQIGVFSLEYNSSCEEITHNEFNKVMQKYKDLIF